MMVLKKDCAKVHLNCAILSCFLLLSAKVPNCNAFSQSSNVSSVVTAETGSGDPLHSAIESLFGQVAKTVVYGGAAMARFNNRLLCTLLTYETERDNEASPTLYVFAAYDQPEHAFRIYADDDITPELVQEAQLDASQPTVVFVHGWLGGIYNELWLSEAKNLALEAAYRSSYSRQTSSSSSSGNSSTTTPAYRPNVIVVDWSELAAGSLYTATQNSLKVSRRLARLLAQLARVGGLKPELVHCFGHSIGAHICGQAARDAFPEQRRPLLGANNWLNETSIGSLKRMGRITALDPGGFCYELGITNETTYRGLKPSDALLVDAYYTNRSPFGNKYLVGHHNVRINNAYFQRPCSVWRNATQATNYFRSAVRFLMGNIGHNDILTCDHYFATRFAHQNLATKANQCSYVGYECDSYRSFVRGRCGWCGDNNNNNNTACYTMDAEYQRPNPSSEHALKHIASHSSHLNQPADENWPLGGVAYDQRKVYYMRTSQEAPYCSATFRIRVRLNAQLSLASSNRADHLIELNLFRPLRDSNRNRKSEGKLALHGPWPMDDSDYHYYGLDNRTLTALFELAQPSQIDRILVVYDRQLGPANLNPVESIHVDYLSSSDANIRRQYSRVFWPHQLEVYYKNLEFSRNRNE